MRCPVIPEALNTLLYSPGNEEVQENGHMPPSPSSQDDAEQQKVKKPGLKMSYEEYKQMANLLVLHMRRVEDSVDEGKFMKSVVIQHDFSVYINKCCNNNNNNNNTTKTYKAP